jgi:hypothetical protein
MRHAFYPAMAIALPKNTQMAPGSLCGLLAATAFWVGCATNVRDTALLANNSIMLAPSTARTIFVQNRNSSDNQGMSVTDLGARLRAKGYAIVQDPQSAAYVVLSNIVYCNQTKVELPIEDIVATGYSSGIGSSIMSGLHGLTGIASMAGPQGARLGGAASMGLNAAEGIGNAVGNIFVVHRGPMLMRTSIRLVSRTYKSRNLDPQSGFLPCRPAHRTLLVSIKPARGQRSSEET